MLTAFLIFKGVLGGLSVVLLVIHMQALIHDGKFESLGRVLRYMALFGSGVALATRSLEQVHEHEFHPQFSTWLGFFVSALLVVATGRSVWETRHGAALPEADARRRG